MNKISKKLSRNFRMLSVGQRTLYKSLAIFMTIFILATILSQGVFVRPSNLMNLIVQNVLLGTVAFGQFYVILTGGIDLSVGSVIGFTSVSIVLFHGLGVIPAIILSLLISVAFGFINGALVTYLKLPAFIVTMGTMQIIYSFTQVLSGGAAVYRGYDGTLVNEGLQEFFRFKILGISVPVFLYVGFILLALLYMRTSTGHFTYSIGGNEEAAKFSGIPTKKVKISAYLISSLLAGIGGLIYIFRVGEGNPQAGVAYPLDTVAAVVVGGASLSGGIGTVIGTVLGVLTISMLGNVMNLLAISPMMQLTIKGIIILLAVYMNTNSKKQ